MASVQAGIHSKVSAHCTEQLMWGLPALERIRTPVLVNDSPDLYHSQDAGGHCPLCHAWGSQRSCEQSLTFPLKLLPVWEMASGAMKAGVPAVLESWASFPSN